MLFSGAPETAPIEPSVCHPPPPPAPYGIVSIFLGTALRLLLLQVSLLPCYICCIYISPIFLFSFFPSRLSYIYSALPPFQDAVLSKDCYFLGHCHRHRRHRVRPTMSLHMQACLMTTHRLARGDKHIRGSRDR